MLYLQAAFFMAPTARRRADDIAAAERQMAQPVLQRSVRS